VARSRNADREAREARERLRRFNARQGVHDAQVRRRRRDNVFAVAGAVLVAALAAVTQVVYFTAGPGAPLPVPSVTSSPDATTGQNIGDIPDPSTAEAKTWDGTLVLNENVTVGFELDGAAAPQAVAAFLQETADGYFTGKTCHRLVIEPSRLIQCGSLAGDGAGDPTYMFGPIENAPADQVYPAGTIALARAKDAAYTQGHQFFIMLADGTLPNDAAGGYTIFGKVTSGLDGIVSSIWDGGTKDGSDDGPPAVPTEITSVTIG
jgi:peptidyl-prolyl cis-trans isomerase B (cyclophilin B)